MPKSIFSIKTGLVLLFLRVSIANVFCQDNPQEFEVAQRDIATETSSDGSKIIIPKHLKTGKPQYFRTNEKRSGFILNDSILIPLEYEELDHKYTDFMLAKRRGLWGAINKKGEAVLPFEFRDLRHSKKGTLLAMKLKDYGLISRKNEVLVPFEFKSVNPAPDSVLIFMRQGKQLIINVLNEDQIETLNTFDYENFEEIGGSKRAIFAAKPKGGKYGIVSIKNEVCLPFEYEKISWAKGNFVGFSNAKEFRGLANLQNQIRIPALYRSLNPTENPNIFQVSDERWKTGIVDSMGRVVVPIQYNYCFLVSNSAFVKYKSMGGHWGLYGTDGIKRTEEIYEDFSVNKLAPELVFAQLPGNQKWQILDAKGQVVNRDLLDSYYFFQSGFKCEIGDKAAIFDLSGKQLTGFVYTKTQGFDSLEDAERQARQAGLPQGVLLVCRAMNANGAFVFVDNSGQEFPVK